MRLLVLLSVLLSACETKEDTQPIADAGPDQLVTPGETVQLDGRASNDKDGRVASYAWTQVSVPAGSSVSFDGTDPTPRFEADAIGRYVFSLAVTDNDGNASYPDMVEIVSVQPAERPVAVLDSYGSLGVGLPLSLDGSQSSPGDGDEIISWNFSLIHAPAGAAASIETTGTGSQARITPDTPGTWLIGLGVSDGLLSSTVTTSVFEVEETPNQSPIAVCGSDQEVVVGDMARLNGSSSIDPEGESLSYEWTVIGPPESETVIVDQGRAASSFLADVPGTFEVRLQVTDGTLTSTPCTARINAVGLIGNQAPIADAGGDHAVPDTGVIITLDGTASYDPDGDPISHAWSLVSVPPGIDPAAETITSATSPIASFAANATGTYIAQIVVCDPADLCGSDTARIVVGMDDNQAPIANAGSAADIEVRLAATLDGSASFDPDGDALIHRWTLLSRPAGSAALLERDDQADAVIIPDQSGEYVARLEVSDGRLTDTDLAILTAHPVGTPLAPVCTEIPNQVTDMGVGVELSAEGTSDPNGDPLEFAWTVIESPPDSSGIFADDAGVTTEFTPDLPGLYLLLLSVSDGELSCNTTVVVEAIDNTPNQPPLCDAGGDQVLVLGETATLDATATEDPDGDALLYEWSVFDSPGATAPEIVPADSSLAAFLPESVGVYTLSFTASDEDESCTEYIVIDVQAPVVNTPPDCVLNGPETANLGDSIEFDASASRDVDGDALAIDWTLTEQPADSSAAFAPAGGTATVIADAPGTYTASIEVSDGTESCVAAFSVVVASGNTPPTCAVEGPTTALPGTSINLDATASSDEEGDSLAYLWSVLERPVASTKELVGANESIASFVPDVAGNYVFSITVSDGFGECSTTLAVSVEALPNTTPSCSAGGDQESNIGELVVLDGTGTADADGDDLTYNWSVIEQPDESVAALVASSTTTPSIEPDAVGIYRFELRASDGIDDCIDFATLTVAVRDTGTAPTTDTGPVTTFDTGADTASDTGIDTDVDMGVDTASDTGSDTGLATAFDTATDTGTILGGSAPVCDAGVDVSSVVDRTVSLDATGTTDADGDVLAYQWTALEQPTSSVATLRDANSPVPEFSPDVPGVYTFELSVNDGTWSCTDTVTLTVSSGAIPPSCEAGDDIATDVGDFITIDGSGTADADGDALEYNWSIIERPEGSVAGIVERTTATPRFQPDVAGTYIFEITATDGLATCSDTTTVTAGVNAIPTCEAGADVAVEVGEFVSLNGSETSDADGDDLTFFWSLAERPEGSVSGIIGRDTPKPSFQPDVAGTYVFSLSATDGEADCTDTVTLTAGVNAAPACEAGTDFSVENGTFVTLDGTGTADADGDVLVFGWTLLERPESSLAAILESDTETPRFQPDAVGTYVFEISATDGTETCSDVVTLTVTGRPPACNAGDDASVYVGDFVDLNGSLTTDPDGDTLAYYWSVLERPEGSTAGLIARDSSLARFQPDAAGTFVFELTANDGTESCSDTVTWTAETNTPPSCNAGEDLLATRLQRVDLDGSATVDSDGDAIDYYWFVLERPEGSVNGLIDRASATASFYPDVSGVYTFEITASDGREDCTDTVTLTVETGTPPVCDAGGNQEATVGDRVYFDATASSDPDGDALTYYWYVISRPEGSVHGLIGRDTARASFFPDVAGDYTIQVVGSDGENTCDADIILLVSSVGDGTAGDGDGGTGGDAGTGSTTGGFSDAGGTDDGAGTGTGSETGGTTDGGGGDSTGDATGGTTGDDTGIPSPTVFADAGRDKSLCSIDDVELNGTDSTGSISSYQWAFSSKPTASDLTNADIDDRFTALASFTPDAEGRYVLQLVVADAASSDTDTVAVTVETGGSVLTLHLDEGAGSSAVDSSPFGNDSVAADGTWTGGRFFSAMAFDGSSNIQIGDAPQLDMDSDFSIDWWMRTGDIGEDWRAILTKGTESNYNYSLWMYQDELHFYGVDATGAYVSTSAVSGTIGDGAWHHYAVTVSDSNVILYEDGLVLASGAVTNPLQTNTTDLYIGRPAYSSTVDTFIGAIDEVVIRSSILTAENIAFLAAADTQYCTGNEDSRTPTGEITDPVGATSTDIGYVKVEGTASDESAVASVSVNGSAAAPTSDNYATWVAYVPLSEGANTLTLRVEDAAGNINASADSVSVERNDFCGEDTLLLLAFDEDGPGTAVDWGPSSNDGSEADVGRVIGRFGNALSASGAGTVLVPHDSALDSIDELTLELWMRRDGPSSDVEILAVKGDPSSFGLVLSGEMLVFGFNDADDVQWTAMASGVTDGEWHHVVGVYDGTEVALYVDGSLAASTPTLGAVPAISTADISIASFYGTGAFFTGAIDQLYLFDRALSASEVVEQYAAGESCPLGDNLALLADASASSTLNPLFRADNVIDNDTREAGIADYTMWLGESGAPGWVTLDFGSVVGILRVRWANTHNRLSYDRATADYRIEASTTGAFGDEAITIASGTGSLEDDLSFNTEESTPVAARYLRFYSDGYEGLGPGINEIQVYGLE